MKRRMSACFGALSLVIVACGNEPESDVADSQGAATVGAELTSSPSFGESQSLTPSDPAAAKAYAALDYSPLTSCDLLLWADAEDAKLETDPASFAAWAGGAPPKAAKKKMSYQDARVLAGRYLAFSDPDANKTAKVHDAWVASLINRGLSLTRLTGVTKTTAGATFSPAALNECNVYMDSITKPTWSCLQHMVADYLAVKNGYDKLGTAPDLMKLPFYGAIKAAPGTPVTPATSEKRRYVLPTVSYRTMKALSGYWPAIGKKKELQDLASEAVKYFQTHEHDDYRSKAKKPGNSNWQGYWDTDSRTGAAIPYCDFASAASELTSSP